MDQMIENLIKLLFGDDETDPKYQFAFHQFMEQLEPTVEDLSRAFIEVGGADKSLCYGRLKGEVEREIS
jgi:hypothetical protein